MKWVSTCTKVLYTQPCKEWNRSTCTQGKTSVQEGSRSTQMSLIPCSIDDLHLYTVCGKHELKSGDNQWEQHHRVSFLSKPSSAEKSLQNLRGYEVYILCVERILQLWAHWQSSGAFSSSGKLCWDKAYVWDVSKAQCRSIIALLNDVSCLVLRRAVTEQANGRVIQTEAVPMLLVFFFYIKTELILCAKHSLFCLLHKVPALFKRQQPPIPVTQCDLLWQLHLNPLCHGV